MSQILSCIALFALGFAAGAFTIHLRYAAKRVDAMQNTFYISKPEAVPTSKLPEVRTLVSPPVAPSKGVPAADKAVGTPYEPDFMRKRIVFPEGFDDFMRKSEDLEREKIRGLIDGRLLELGFDLIDAGLETHDGGVGLAGETLDGFRRGNSVLDPVPSTLENHVLDGLIGDGSEAISDGGLSSNNEPLSLTHENSPSVGAVRTGLGPGVPEPTVGDTTDKVADSFPSTSVSGLQDGVAAPPIAAAPPSGGDAVSSPKAAASLPPTD